MKLFEENPISLPPSTATVTSCGEDCLKFALYLLGIFVFNIYAPRSLKGFDHRIMEVDKNTKKSRSPPKLGWGGWFHDFSMKSLRCVTPALRGIWARVDDHGIWKQYWGFFSKMAWFECIIAWITLPLSLHTSNEDDTQLYVDGIIMRDDIYRRQWYLE